MPAYQPPFQITPMILTLVADINEQLGRLSDVLSHSQTPGWEIPKMRPEFFTDRFGLITDYLAKCISEMRKRSFADAIDKYFSCAIISSNRM